jgi:hypothetical protein
MGRYIQASVANVRGYRPMITDWELSIDQVQGPGFLLRCRKIQIERRGAQGARRKAQDNPIKI